MITLTNACSLHTSGGINLGCLFLSLFCRQLAEAIIAINVLLAWQIHTPVVLGTTKPVFHDAPTSCRLLASL
jgi:hypothetical protein